MWSRVGCYIKRKNLTGDSLETFKLMLLCIAAVTVQCEQDEGAFSKLLEAASPTSSRFKGKNELPKTYVEYREIELRDPEHPVIDPGKSILGEVFLENQAKIASLAQKLTTLWQAVAVSHHLDVLVLPLLSLTSTADAIMTDNCLTPQGSWLFTKIRSNGMVTDHYKALAPGMAVTMALVKNETFNSPKDLRDFTPTVCFCII